MVMTRINKKALIADAKKLTEYIPLGKEALNSDLERDQPLANQVAIQACLSDMRALMSLKGGFVVYERYIHNCKAVCSK